VLGRPVKDQPNVPNAAQLLLMIFTLNPTRYFTVESVHQLPAFASLKENVIRGKLRSLANAGVIIRCEPGIFQFNPVFLEYRSA
jgi:hypothetical protein